MGGCLWSQCGCFIKVRIKRKCENSAVFLSALWKCLTTQTLQAAAILLFQFLFPVCQRLWFENAEFPFVLLIRPQGSSELYQYIATGIKSSLVYSPELITICTGNIKQHFLLLFLGYTSYNPLCNKHLTSTLMLHTCNFPCFDSHYLCYLFLISGHQMTSGFLLFSFCAVLGEKMNRKGWRDVLAMLLAAGCFQNAPQHLTACWKDFLVTICNWKVALLLLPFLTVIKLSLLLSCHF